MLVEQTKLYSNQFFQTNPDLRTKPYYLQWNLDAVTPISMKAFLACLLYMGIVKLPSIRHHWKTSSLYSKTIISNVFSRDEFSLYLKFFHISNNEFDDKSDKLYKLRPVILTLNGKYKRFFQPGPEITIDEKMIKFHGRSKFKQFLKDKPTKWGFKIFILADSVSGYVHSWKMYEGKEDKPVKNLIQKIVLELTEGLSNQGHKLYMDSYYTTITIAQELAKLMIGVTATIKKNSKNP